MADEPAKHPKNFVDFTGRRFGRLVAIEYSPVLSGKGQKVSAWRCLCDCGKEKVARSAALYAGNTQSCGCYHRDQCRKASTTHGMTGTTERNIYNTMIQRCCNPNNQNYYKYGGRGITVCDRWKESFENFLADMGMRPGKEYSIDRKQNSGNYEPGNCRWATATEQAKNTRKNVNLTFNGKTQCMSDWGKETGLGVKRISSRLKRGWSVEMALTSPLDKDKMNKEYR